MMQIIGAEVEQHLNWTGLMDALEAGHRLPRAEIKDMFLYRGKDTLLTRAAWIDGLGQLVKGATVFPGNGARNLPAVNGGAMLYDDQTGALQAVIDFHLLTKWKTAGDSLLAARHLARKDSQKILLVGAGAVARSMMSAYASLFPQARFTVWARNADSAAGMGAPVAHDLESAVRAADVICTATMATAPLIQGAWLQPGQHLDLIGAYRPDMREVDDLALQRASLFVDSRATTLGHIGELKDPLARRVIRESDVRADYYDLPQGLFRRSGADEITIAKNGGGAHLDLMTAGYILNAAAQTKVGPQSGQS